LRLVGLAVALGLLALAAGAAGEATQKHGLIVSFGGSIVPRVLPRSGTAPIEVTIEGRVRTAQGAVPPSLGRLVLEINRNGVLDRHGLPSCHLPELRSASSRAALAACRSARVGDGLVGGQVTLPEQPPFEFRGHVIAFNGRTPDGDPAILAHLYSNDPAALTFVLALRVKRIAGTYGTRLVATIPLRSRRILHVTRFRLHLGRTYRAGGRLRSYLSAGCPAPPGFPGANFPLARASYDFVGGTSLHSVIVRTCHART
jgi:hypothetical protein